MSTVTFEDVIDAYIKTKLRPCYGKSAEFAVIYAPAGQDYGELTAACGLLACEVAKHPELRPTRPDEAELLVSSSLPFADRCGFIAGFDNPANRSSVLTQLEHAEIVSSPETAYSFIRAFEIGARISRLLFVKELSPESIKLFYDDNLGPNVSDA